MQKFFLNNVIVIKLFGHYGYVVIPGKLRVKYFLAIARLFGFSTYKKSFFSLFLIVYYLLKILLPWLIPDRFAAKIELPKHLLEPVGDFFIAFS